MFNRCAFSEPTRVCWATGTSDTLHTNSQLAAALPTCLGVWDPV